MKPNWVWLQFIICLIQGALIMVLLLNTDLDPIKRYAVFIALILGLTYYEAYHLFPRLFKEDDTNTN